MNKFLELLKKALTEGKIDGKYAELETGFNEAVKESETGLRKNRDDLLTEKKEAVTALEALKEATKGIDIKEYTRLVEEEEERKIRKEAGEDDDNETDETLKKELSEAKINLARLEKKAERELKEVTDKLEAATTLATDREKRLFGSEKVSSLNKAFDDFNIKPEFRSILRDALGTKTTVEIDDEGKLAVTIVGDDAVPLPVEDYFKNWSVTDAAKPYIGAKANKGGGAGGGGGGGNEDEIVDPKTVYEGQFSTEAAS